MAEVGFSLTTDVSIFGNNATIAFDSNNNDFNIGIVNQAAEGALTLQGNGGQSQVNLETQNIANGATINIVGFIADIVLSPGDLARYANGDFTLQAVDPLFAPSDIPSAIAAFDPLDGTNITATEWLPIYSVPNNFSITESPGFSFPLFEESVCRFTGGQRALLSNYPANIQYIFLVIADFSGSTTRIVWDTQTSNFRALYFNRSSDAFQRRGLDGGGFTIWNVNTDIDGNILEGLPGDYNSPVGTGAIPGGQSFAILTSLTDDDVFEFVGDALDIAYLAFFNERPSNSDIQKLMAFGAYRLLDAGKIADVASLIDSTSLYINQRPTNTGSGAISEINSVIAPDASFDRIVLGAPAGAAIAIFKRSSSLTADRSQFTLASGNDVNNSTLVINEAIPVDTPSSGFIRIARDNGAEDRIAYTSWAGSTFSLDGQLPASYSLNNGAYVGYLDVLNSSTGTESVALQYTQDRQCVLSIRLGSGPNRMLDIRQDITLGASDFGFQVSAQSDLINTYV